MTEKEARNITDPESLPWDAPVLGFVPGRYYLGVYYLPFPDGNVVAMCWRYDQTPRDWVVNVRFRHYRDKKVFNSEDRKSWYAFRTTGKDESEMEVMMSQLDQIISVAAGAIFPVASDEPKGSMIVKGNSEKAMAVLLLERPDWMHVQVASS